jgi:hypothetical protein
LNRRDLISVFLPGAVETYRFVNGGMEFGKEILEHREKGKDSDDICHWLVEIDICLR